MMTGAPRNLDPLITQQKNRMESATTAKQEAQDNIDALNEAKTHASTAYDNAVNAEAEIDDVASRFKWVGTHAENIYTATENGGYTKEAFRELKQSCESFLQAINAEIVQQQINKDEAEAAYNTAAFWHGIYTAQKAAQDLLKL